MAYIEEEGTETAWVDGDGGARGLEMLVVLAAAWVAKGVEGGPRQLVVLGKREEWRLESDKISLDRARGMG